MGSELTLTARWIVPVAESPLQRGTVTITGDRITAVEPRGCRAADIDLGNVAILPGLVNAHAHLDLTGSRNNIKYRGDLLTWLRDVVEYRRSASVREVSESIEAALSESLALGVTLLGDIASQGLSAPALAKARLRSTVFYELLGLQKTRAQQAWADACEWLAHVPAGPNYQCGLSPHAPYSVRPSLFRAAANLSNGRRAPLAVHLGESLHEIDLLENHNGPLVEFLTELGVWDPNGLVSGIDEVLDLERRAERTLFIHCNYLQTAPAISERATIVYCPRTHRAFGHAPYPLDKFLQAGIRVALGTDSLASNPDLSILAEARYVHERFPDIPGEMIVRMATLNGAEALGWAAETGSLAARKSADLVVLPLPNEEERNLHALILRTEIPIVATMFRGKWVSVSSGWETLLGALS
jgi:cytosine/adenosine deaminase-related metal-dependent hydrolase